MKSIKFVSAVILLSSLFLYNGCTPNKVAVSDGGYYHSNIYFGKNLSDNFKKGIRDGCTTSKGDYKKAHSLFNNDKDYNDGWFLGRNKCKDLLVLDEE